MLEVLLMLLVRFQRLGPVCIASALATHLKSRWSQSQLPAKEVDEVHCVPKENFINMIEGHAF